MRTKTSWLANQLEQKEEEIAHLHEILDNINEGDKTNKQNDLKNSWLNKTKQSITEVLSERFRYERLYMSTDWRTKIKLHEICPLEYYYEKLLLCANREVFNLLDINHGCKQDMDMIKECSLKREQFMQEFKKQERLQQETMKSSIFYPASGITENHYKTHLEKSKKEFEKMMQNFNKE